MLLLGVVAYIVAQLALGLLVSSRIRNEQDYLKTFDIKLTDSKQRYKECKVEAVAWMDAFKLKYERGPTVGEKNADPVVKAMFDQ